MVGDGGVWKEMEGVRGGDGGGSSGGGGWVVQQVQSVDSKCKATIAGVEQVG